MCEPRLHPRSLFGIREVLGEGLAQLLPRGGRILVLGDVAAAPNHLGQCPVSNAVTVREAPSPVPVLVVDEPVDVLLELPGQTRLSDAGDSGDGDELCLVLFRSRVEELLDEPKLAVAADERRLEARRAHRAEATRSDAKRTPQLHLLRLALELGRPDLLVGNRGFGGASCRLTDEHVSRLGRGLDPRRCVDEVSGDHPLPFGPDRDGGLARENSCSRP